MPSFAIALKALIEAEMSFKLSATQSLWGISMNINRVFLLLTAMFSLLSCEHMNSTSQREIEAPKAAKIEKKLITHGDTRIDPYYWIKERDNPQVLALLNDENTYADFKLKPVQSLQKTLFEELKSRIIKDDQTAPVYDNGYYYYRRTTGAKEYPIICRRKGSMTSPEEVLLDVNRLSKDSNSYLSVPYLAVSPDNQWLAYPIDRVGRRIYDIHIFSMEKERTQPVHIISGVSGNMTWATDNQHLIFTRSEPETLRVYQVVAFHLPSKKETLLYTENNSEFMVGVSKTLSKKYLLIESSAKESTEIRFVDANSPLQALKIFAPRKKDIQYSIEHGAGDQFQILTNLRAKNFQVMTAPIEESSHQKWKTLIKHQKDTLLEQLEVFENHLVLTARKNGLVELHIYDQFQAGAKPFNVPMPHESYFLGLSSNVDAKAQAVRISYSSPSQPWSEIDIDLNSKKTSVVKQAEVGGKKFEPNDYEVKRLFVTVAKGVRVPISLVRHKQYSDRKPPRLYVTGYGSYGMSLDPYFSASQLSLLERGFTIATIHVRGGSEMGYSWYEDGKYLKKKNTFSDFIAGTEFLIEQGYGVKGRVFAQGGSAGGLLMGAIANLRPDLYQGIIADVPFVDVVTTMLDESIPLTTFEYQEWGNPNQKKFYSYMKSYSPYDNVKAQSYPYMLINSGFHDSQVQYFEPTKWAQKLRDFNTQPKNFTLLRTEMQAGHGGASGRFKALEDLAWSYAFTIGIAEGVLF